MTSKLKTGVTINDNAVQDGQTIDAADVTTAFDDAQSELREGWVSVSANDANVKHLEDALTAGTGITIATANDGADESMSITLATHDHQDTAGGGQLLADAIDSQTATNGYVLTADGSGGASWASVGGGGAQPIDLTATAGETLALRDMVYLDESSGTWFKLDVDATSSIKAGALRGCVNEASGIASASTGSVRILGEVSGFTGLTAWTRVYGTTTAGGYTQTRPAVSDGGSQIAIAEMGYAVSTSIIFIDPKPVIYAKRETLANDGTMTIEHHSDAQTRKRDARAYVGTTVAGSVVAEYADTNQGGEFTLAGFESASGGTLDVDASGGQSNIGDVADSENAAAQQFTPAASGQLTQIKVTLTTNSGTPSGDITWQIYTDDGSDLPDTEIATGSFTPTESAENTINVSGGPILDGSTKYWLVLTTVDQSTNDRYRWQASDGNTYVDHLRLVGARDADFSTWSEGGTVRDNELEITTSAATTSDKLAQSFQVSSPTPVVEVDLWLKKVGSPTGNLTVEIQTDSAGEPSGTAVTNGTSSTVSASTLTTSFADITFSFASNPSLASGTTYWIVLTTADSQSNTNYVVWGADTSSPSYADGSMSGEDASTWSALSADAIFTVTAPATQYDERCVVGRWSGGTRDIAVRFDDGGAGSPNTNTTFKNVSGGSLDIVAEVEVQ